MKPLLTVVIPVYNVEKYLKRCIDSILVQEWKHYDILLVDDGSSDDSPKICDDYAKAYDFISVIHKENGGLSEARNTGISNAEGDYLYFPDSDDWIEPNTFSDLAEVIESDQYDIISFNREFVKSEDDIIKSDSKQSKRLTGKESLLEMFSYGFITGFANDKIYRKLLFTKNNIQFPIGKYYEDLGTNYKLFLLAEKVYATNQKYYHYLIDNPDAITKSWNEQKLENMISFFKEIYYSDDVRSKLDFSELAIAKMFFVDGMTHSLASLYKSNLYKSYPELTKDVKNELKKNKLTFTELSKLNHRTKYILYKLGLLQGAFRVQHLLKK